jgi:hypothetical protein
MSSLFRVDTSKLSLQEIEDFRPGLEALQEFAIKNRTRFYVWDVKHKRSGPIISCGCPDAEFDDIADDIFEAAMDHTES